MKFVGWHTHFSPRSRNSAVVLRRKQKSTVHCPPRSLPYYHMMAEIPLLLLLLFVGNREGERKFTWNSSQEAYQIYYWIIRTVYECDFCCDAIQNNRKSNRTFNKTNTVPSRVETRLYTLIPERNKSFCLLLVKQMIHSSRYLSSNESERDERD